MKIPYVEKVPNPSFSKIFPHAKSIYKPLITVALKNGERKQKLFALVDSGADACLFPRGMAEQLGIGDVKSGERLHFTGLGGDQNPFFFHEVEILLGPYHVKTKVGFSASYSIGVSGILGQLGFFEHFLIHFDHQNKYIEVKQHGLFQHFTSKMSFNVF